MINVVVLSGRLVCDPELKFTKSEVTVTSFAIAVNKKFANKGDENNADFFNIVAWKKNAEFICKYFNKGSLIEIEGYLNTSSYPDKEGKKINKTEIIVNSASFGGSKQKEETPVEDDGDLPF